MRLNEVLAVIIILTSPVHLMHCRSQRSGDTHVYIGFRLEVGRPVCEERRLYFLG